MQVLLGFIVLCSLISPLEGVQEGSPPGILVVVSPRAFSKYVSTVFLRNRLIQSHILAIQFPPGSPLMGKEMGQSIQGLHVVKVYLPSVSMELKGNSTPQVHLKARLHLGAQYHFSHLFERFDLIVDVHFMADVVFQNYSAGIIQVKHESCETQLTITQIICPSYLIKAQVRPLALAILMARLPNALCQVVDAVGNVALFDLLYTANVLLPVRSAITLRYHLAALPRITPTAFVMQLNILIRTARRFLDVPSSNHPIAIPSLSGHDLCLVLAQDVLNGILSVVIRVAPQEFITTPQVFTGSIQLMDAVAVLLSHQKCPKCSERSPLKILLRVVEEARVILKPSTSHFRLALEIAVAAKDPLGAITELFVLKATLKLNIEMSVHDNRLIFYMTLSKVDLLVISSEIGHISVTSLAKWIHLLLVELFMPHINDSLDGGIPVPSVLNIKMDYPKFLIFQGSLALCV